MLARMSISASIAGFACRICRRALRRYRPDDERGPDGRPETIIWATSVGSNLPVTNRRKSGKKVSMGVDRNERPIGAAPAEFLSKHSSAPPAGRRAARRRCGLTFPRLPRANASSTPPVRLAVEPFAEGACGSHTRRGWIRNSSGDLAEPSQTLASLGYAGMQGEHTTVVENTPKLHNMVVCTLCSCYPWRVLGLPPVWYKSGPYRSRAVMDPRGVLREKIRLRRLQSVKKLSKGVDSFFDHISAVGRQSIARSSAGNSTVPPKKDFTRRMP